MNIKDRFNIKEIPTEIAKPFILKKHYAERIPSVSYCFGLHKEKDLVGICTFGVTFNYAEDEAWGEYDVFELNRLVTIEDLPKNTLSYFVSQSLNKMPKPSVIISYADKGKGHHGYIYQATNFIYTGIGGKGKKKYVMKDGEIVHQRSLESPDEIKEMKRNGQIKKVIKTKGKYRYYYFVGNKRQKRKMREKLRFKEKPYPKGNNKRHKEDIKVNSQKSLI